MNWRQLTLGRTISIPEGIKLNKETRFSFADSVRVERILSQYPDRRSATLPLLHLAQAQAGYISQAVIDAVAKLVEANPAEIMDTVTFYTMLYTERQGKYILQICQTLPCALNGADELMDHACKKLSIRPGETTEDARFTLMPVECLGSCGTAPVVQVNAVYHEEMTVQELDRLLESLP